MSVKPFMGAGAIVFLSEPSQPDSGPGGDSRGRISISFDIGCSDECDAFSAPLCDQLSVGYETCSVLPTPKGLDEWRAEHRTARKRADRARRLGYVGGLVERHEHADDIYDINTSLGYRQGRPMTAGYLVRPSPIPDPWPRCSHHCVHPYGVYQDETLVAYLWLYRSGELALVSQILGHGDHLANDVMYLLFETMLDYEVSHPGVVVYNRHDSGTDGLRYYKSKLGFEARDVEWRL